MPIGTTGTYLVAWGHALPSFVHEISYLAYPQSYRMPTHQHRGLELLVCFSGLTLLETESAQYLVPPGTVTLFESSMPHRIHVLIPPYRRWLLHIDPSYFFRNGTLRQLARTPVQFKIDTKEQAEAALHMHVLFRQLRGGDQGTGQSYPLVQRIADWMYEFSQARSAQPIPLDASEYPSDVITAIVDTIHRAGFHTTVQSLAERVRYSESHLRRLFRQVTTMSISDYVRIQRLEEAQRRLLTESEHPQTITRIAKELGFQSVAYFSRYFREHTGHSPTEYQSLRHLA